MNKLRLLWYRWKTRKCDAWVFIAYLININKYNQFDGNGVRIRYRSYHAYRNTTHGITFTNI